MSIGKVSTVHCDFGHQRTDSNRHTVDACRGWIGQGETAEVRAMAKAAGWVRHPGGRDECPNCARVRGAIR